jgi:hypothetical protein
MPFANTVQVPDVAEFPKQQPEPKLSPIAMDFFTDVQVNSFKGVWETDEKPHHALETIKKTKNPFDDDDVVAPATEQKPFFNFDFMSIASPQPNAEQFFKNEP